MLPLRQGVSMVLPVTHDGPDAVGNAHEAEHGHEHTHEAQAEQPIHSRHALAACGRATQEEERRPAKDGRRAGERP